MKQVPPVAPDWLTPELFALLDVVFIWIPLAFLILTLPLDRYVVKHYVEQVDLQKHGVVVFKETIPESLRRIYTYHNWLGGAGIISAVLYITLIRPVFIGMLQG